MPTPIDLYWSFRSPYSYLSLKPAMQLAERRDVTIHPKVVLPLAVRDPDFLPSRGPAWMMYLLRDVFRAAQMTGQVMARPNPDPIIIDPQTLIAAEDQPYIWRLSRLGLVACDTDYGMKFLSEVSQLIWSGTSWNEGDALQEAVSKSGLDLEALEAQVTGQEDVLDAKLDRHDKELRAAGHWGVPTFVLNDEPFFGMDRLDALEWRLDQMGVG